VITKVPLEYAADRWLGKAHKGALVRIEAKACLNQTRARDLDEVVLVLTAIQELPGEPLGEPEMRSDHFVEDLLPPEGPCRLGLDEQLTRTLGELLARDALVSRNDRGDNGERGVRHERATLSS
jgi:hypothetical protein